MMNKNSFSLVLILIVVAVVTTLLVNSTKGKYEAGLMMSDEKTEEMVSVSDEMMDEKKSGETMETEEIMMDDTNMNNGAYVSYSKEVLDSASEGKRVLFFYANWCPTCRPADAEFKEKEEKLPEGLTLIRVNYNDDDTNDEEKALASKYGISYQHTFVQIDADGEEVVRWNGGSIDELLENIE